MATRCHRGCPEVDEGAEDDDRFKFVGSHIVQDGHEYYQQLAYNGQIIKPKDIVLVSYWQDDPVAVDNELHPDEALVRITNMWYCPYYMHKFIEVNWYYRYGDIEDGTKGKDKLPTNCMVESISSGNDRDELFVSAILGKCDMYLTKRNLPGRRVLNASGLLDLRDGRYSLRTDAKLHGWIYLPDLSRQEELADVEDANLLSASLPPATATATISANSSSTSSPLKLKLSRTRQEGSKLLGLSSDEEEEEDDTTDESSDGNDQQAPVKSPNRMPSQPESSGKRTKSQSPASNKRPKRQTSSAEHERRDQRRKSRSKEEEGGGKRKKKKQRSKDEVAQKLRKGAKKRPGKKQRAANGSSTTIPLKIPSPATIEHVQHLSAAEQAQQAEALFQQFLASQGKTT